MDEATAWSTLASERRALADLLEGLTEDQWRHRSLCGEWDVAEVATHMMMGPTGSLFGFATAMVRARGSFDRANRIMVSRRMSRPRRAIVEDLRSHATHRFTPPGFDWHAPLTDFLVHRLDILVPLGLPDDDADGRRAAWPDALHFLLTPKAAAGFGTKGMPAVSFHATDVDWDTGEGPRVEGPVDALALAMTRRPALLDQLAGPGADNLGRWARG